MWTQLFRNLLVLLFLCLCGCTRHSYNDRVHADLNPEVPVGKLDFGWRLSGDRAIAPLQIFSDSQRIWIQWGPQQTLPALIGLDSQGERVLPYRKQGPYTVLDGPWVQLYFRAGTRQARARRLSGSEQDDRSTSASIAPPVKSHQAVPVAASVTYAVTLKDSHLRQALSRWASIGGWRFQSDHWVVDVDIPLTADAEFSDDFIDSVRALVSSTELSDRPLQPCFYSNRVLRIVPLTEHCDRTVEQGAAV